MDTINDLKRAYFIDQMSVADTGQTVDDLEMQYLISSTPAGNYTMNDRRYLYWKSRATNPLPTDTVNDLERNAIVNNLSPTPPNYLTLNDLRYLWYSPSDPI